MKHLLTTAAAFGLALLSAVPEAQAQSADKKTGISLYGSGLQYIGDLGTGAYKYNRIGYGGGVTISRYITPGIDIGLAGNYGILKYTGKNGTAHDGVGFEADATTINIPIKLKLNNGWALKEDAVIAPYLLIAPGVLIASSDHYQPERRLVDNVNYKAFDLHGAAGVAFQFSPGFAVFVQTGIHQQFGTDMIDGVSGGHKDRYLQHSAGITINLGKAKDTDMDGVPDRKDKCPDTPAGVAVDEAGCPLDGDKDGVPDYQDKCPTEAGTAALEGCPDRDNDGVRDSEDECPDQAGTAALKGCPDADGDGVADKNDTCPNTPAGTQVDATGCPIVLDKDGDGVLDNVDKCPGTPTGVPVDSTGCPIIDPAIRSLEKPITFETNSTVIRKSSYPTLNKMVQALKDHPELSIRISGHADSRGTDEYNQGLSERRAESGKKFFVGRQIDPARITTEGFGESQPAAPNTTKAGMAKNRRAEFKFEFYIPSQPQP
ncbi:MULTISPECIES: OmpA family protein [Hymenobacter]|uniref:OmpA family protein n=1 Tax=Hymenobacter jejuensis TaxID=2502781 RepID=A0A5B8A0T6_9BACT|nr:MULTISPECIES: OmpA family protein [Hymenobacter]MBC6990649.1 OmpA family protein [Hymenobacter sp. BT491]QDA60940.1 OmpA family protein [Hymenobacter jejuensis]